MRLYYDEGRDLPAISAATGLSAKAIRAAADRVAAVMTGQDYPRVKRAIPVAEEPDWSPPPASTEWMPPRRRVARLVALPLAHTAPTAVLAEPKLPNVAPANVDGPPAPAPRRVRTVRKPATKPQALPAPVSAVPPAEPEFAPGTQAWTELATSPDVRKWAVADGWQVPGRGQPLPGAIVLAYHKAHPTGGAQ